jgi:hypothetical protein
MADPTALTKVTAAAYGHGIADAGFQAVDNTWDNTFANTGKTLLFVKAVTGSCNVTFKSIGASRYNEGIAGTLTPLGPITVGNIGVYGPFPTELYGTTVRVGYDTSTATAAVVELEQTPI